uniref:Uncharacterized protein n=1 Tax=Anolis carolinensis TaxID=28377 RepID=A0A803TC94_ANOCA
MKSISTPLRSHKQKPSFQSAPEIIRDFQIHESKGHVCFLWQRVGLQCLAFKILRLLSPPLMNMLVFACHNLQFIIPEFAI